MYTYNPSLCTCAVLAEVTYCACSDLQLKGIAHAQSVSQRLAGHFFKKRKPNSFPASAFINNRLIFALFW